MKSYRLKSGASMMLKNILASLMLCLGMYQQAVASPVACITGQELTALTDEYKELPFVRGVSSEGLSVVVFVNTETRSFTVLERRGQNTYCVLVVGVGFEPVPKQIQDDMRQQQEKGIL
jgi:hypothetical protein